MYSATPGLPPWQTGGNRYPNDRTAFIPVSARQSFSHPPPLPPPPTYVPAPMPSNLPPPPPPPPPAPQSAPTSATVTAKPVSSSNSPSTRKRMVWPQPVRDYVQRSFAVDNQIEGVQKPEIEAKLKQVITEATQSGNLDNIDWTKMPLPQQMIHESRNVNTTQYSISTPDWLPSPLDSQMVLDNSISVPVAVDRPRKRKSEEFAPEPEDLRAPPPWRNKNLVGSFEDRISFAPTPEKRQKLDQPGVNASKFNASLENRRKRFEDNRSGSYSPQSATISRGGSPPPSLPSGPIIGRSQKLEKNYFRLTSAPNPEDVRPLEVLRQTLDLLKKKWRSEGNYSYICDQFKSLRQDLTVQHIKNEFTVNVYEIHARIALEKGDLGEYNQCQTQLRALYKQKLGGHPIEFKAYRILYFIYTCNRTDMNDVLSDLTPADKQEEAIKHALDVRSALALGNYHKYFKLYLSVPHMGAYLMDMFIARERVAALASICKSYKPDVKIRFITEELAFESDEESVRFILEHASEELLQERDGDVRLLTSKAGQIFEVGKTAAFKYVDIKGQI